MSPTTAEETPDPENTVAVVEVPVIPVPVYHLPPAVPVPPVEPCLATEYTGSEVVLSVYVNMSLVHRYWPWVTDGGEDCHVPVGAVVLEELPW
jgi:hypothetical protein